MIPIQMMLNCSKGRFFKKTFSLVEFLITLPIVAVFVATLYQGQRFLIQQKHVVEALQSEVFQEEKCYARVKEVLLSATHLSWDEESRVLTFNYKNFVDKDLKFCGELKSSIFVEQGVLVLVTENKTSSRKEILFSGIKTIGCELNDSLYVPSLKMTIHKEGEELLELPFWRGRVS